jgi:hypothetical protein
MMSDDRDAAADLLRIVAAVPVTLLQESVTLGTDEAEFGLRLELSLSFADEESPRTIEPMLSSGAPLDSYS